MFNGWEKIFAFHMDRMSTLLGAFWRLIHKKLRRLGKLIIFIHKKDFKGPVRKPGQ